MAHSVIYTIPSYYQGNKYFKKFVTPSKYESAFADWFLKDQRPPILFSYSEHYGPDITEHSMFVPDSDGKAGYFVHISDGDYVYTEVYFRVLIGIHSKNLFISDVFTHYENMFWGTEDEYSGKMKCFKKMKGKKVILETLVECFFSKEWKVHLGFKKRHEKTYKKSCMKKLYKQIDDNLPKDIKLFIASKMIPWSNTEKTIDMKVIEQIKAIFELNVGSRRDFGKYYPWGCTIAVYDYEHEESHV